MEFIFIMACRFSGCPACGFSLAASFRASLSVVNRLIRPAGLSPAWLPVSPAHHHVGPVAEQIVHWHAHGVDSIFELLDHVLLIAAPVGQTDDLLRGVIDAVGNIEKVTDLI